MNIIWIISKHIYRLGAPGHSHLHVQSSREARMHCMPLCKSQVPLCEFPCFHVSVVHDWCSSCFFGHVWLSPYKMKRNVQTVLSAAQTQPLQQSKPYLPLWCDRFPDYGPVSAQRCTKSPSRLDAQNTGAATYESISSTFACKQCWDLPNAHKVSRHRTNTTGKLRVVRSFVYSFLKFWPAHHTFLFTGLTMDVAGLGRRRFSLQSTISTLLNMRKAWCFFSPKCNFPLFLSLSLSHTVFPHKRSCAFLTRDHAPAPGPLASPLSAPGRSTWPDSINVRWSIAQHSGCISSTCKHTHTH